MARKSYPPITIDWIHVADELPQGPDQWPKVLLIVDRGYILPATCSGGHWHTVNELSAKPTHWARIPSQP